MTSPEGCQHYCKECQFCTERPCNSFHVHDNFQLDDLCLHPMTIPYPCRIPSSHQSMANRRICTSHRGDRAISLAEFISSAGFSPQKGIACRSCTKDTLEMSTQDQWVDIGNDVEDWLEVGVEDMALSEVEEGRERCKCHSFYENLLVTGSPVCSGCIHKAWHFSRHLVSKRQGLFHTISRDKQPLEDDGNDTDLGKSFVNVEQDPLCVRCQKVRMSAEEVDAALALPGGEQVLWCYRCGKVVSILDSEWHVE